MLLTHDLEDRVVGLRAGAMEAIDAALLPVGDLADHYTDFDVEDGVAEVTSTGFLVSSLTVRGSLPILIVGFFKASNKGDSIIVITCVHMRHEDGLGLRDLLFILHFL